MSDKHPNKIQIHNLKHGDSDQFEDTQNRVTAWLLISCHWQNQIREKGDIIENFKFPFTKKMLAEK